MTLPNTLRLNEYGFYEVIDKPSPTELSDYYARRYYQEGLTTYQPSYPPEELEHIEGKLRLRRWVLEQLRPETGAAAPKSFLDIGCGEGWALAHFHRQGWDVLGLDYSSFSVERFQPELRAYLRTGDIVEQLAQLIADGRSFDVLWLDNVLEHVPDPAALLRQCRALVAPSGTLVVEVPNDFSALQNYLLEQGHIDRPFWVVLPDHLAYFNQTGLRNVAQATGWRVAKTLADQPIDLNLLNSATNYVMNRAAGPGAHRARLEQDNLLLRTAPLPAVAAYYEAMAGVGLGRNIVAFLQPV
ncbi:class I SAM-dependent methyltransferase [Hymenobacter armeniacus]|uniref:Class I SAM-dependent methyltransferase n=1 Tax=Hymenobacter armeniacus TaxID=2771358 RepID=A0ABR8JPG3_9BACT|nr:class I SAM-dependent methyltransferase [Hymenobacter armeniacus]MBD2720793.1 class I SAM-dependent methyltransferase [Hymenobacter armeniacus]